MSVRNVVYGIGKHHVGQELHVIVGEATVTFWNTRTGELIAEHPVPEPGVKHVGFGFGPLQPSPEHRTVHDVLINQLSEMS